ncbi:SMP-30/gluconolactonase/LRE family protein [Haloferax gibbonsii]|uniref:SMP-30/gluconolactonase/LRE family protein n=1 Tax=Haloferax gibbonsii TaxID=35746 RepID=UPI0009E4D159|nr:SMP-30/gluconolactonase/LRE family protein [Haloferax gibbonsii]
MTWEFETVVQGCEFTEGPVWSGERILFTDTKASQILAFDPSEGETSIVRSDVSGAIGLKYGREGHLHGCEGDGRQIARYRYGEKVVVADSYQSERLNRPNDLDFDSQNRVIFTDPDYTGQGDELGHDSVYRQESPGNHSLVRLTTDTTRPNGVLLSPDESTLYVAESKYGRGNRRELRAYPIHSDGTLGDYEVLHNFYPHRGIDGMCLDEYGNIIATAGWEKSGPGPMLYVFNPSGRVLETHPYPGARPTNCTFAGTDLSTLYVTDARGRLLRTKTDRVGYPPAWMRAESDVVPAGDE